MLYSIRMRAELKGYHVSGAERIVRAEELDKVLKALLRRPREYDRMNITIEKIENLLCIPKALPIYSHDFKRIEEAHDFAISLLKREGIREDIALRGLELLKRGPSPKGGNMRGAVLMDIESGERLEPDKERGIRTVRFDWKNRNKIKELLKERGIKKFYLERLLDALALATKNIYCGVIAELCWSDDPEYITGYVAGRNIGYVRIKPMKEEGNPIGGRIYFVKGEGIEDLINCLESTPLLIEDL